MGNINQTFNSQAKAMQIDNTETSESTSAAEASYSNLHGGSIDTGRNPTPELLGMLICYLSASPSSRSPSRNQDFTAWRHYSWIARSQSVSSHSRG